MGASSAGRFMETVHDTHVVGERPRQRLALSRRPRRARRARALGVDSIDSALLFWSSENVAAFPDALTNSCQLDFTPYFCDTSRTSRGGAIHIR
jgi:hypothetical protein